MDTDSDRSQTLANFQACTGIEDIGIALGILEEAQWDLNRALQQALAGDDDQFMNDAAPSLNVTGQGIDTTGRFNPPVEPSLMSPGLSMRQREVTDEMGVQRRILSFTAMYNMQVVEVHLQDSATIGELKRRIAQELQISSDLFTIVWENAGNTDENRTLQQLNLPRENNLTLVPNQMNIHTDPCSSTAEDSLDRSLSHNLSQVYKLSIRCNLGGQTQIHAMDQFGATTVREVKDQVSVLTGVPIEEQHWEGWPPDVTDDLTIAACQITRPFHSLYVRKQSADDLSTTIPRVTLSDSDESNDHDVDAMEEDLDIEVIGGRISPERNKHLIPSDVSDTTEAMDHFNTEFRRRYGRLSFPVFYIGSLESAVNEAFPASCRERRLLAVYLHHDDSIASNVFCSQVLCSETVVNYLSANFLLWGWDLTLALNRTRFQNACEKVMGKSASDYVRRLTVDQLPILIIISKVRNSLEILATSHATVTGEELMTTLLHADDVFQQQKSQDILEEEERLVREETKRLQDEEYEKSLETDRNKERQRQLEEKAREEELKQKQEEEQLKAVLKQSLVESMPDEPAEDCPDTMARLRFRCPDGQMVFRRFLGSNKLEILFNYLITQGYNKQEYKVLTTFPRRDLSTEDSGRTLEELKLCPQETLILEAK